MRRRKSKSLVDSLFKNLSLPNSAPAARIPKRNAPRSMPRRTGPFVPLTFSKN